jgi:Protein of unknown function (DUF1579)
MPRTMTGLLMSLALSIVPVAAAAQAPPPTPGPEHAILKEDVGTWDASLEMMVPGAPPAAASKGVEVNAMGCNGLCLVTDFKGEIMGGPFHGHGVSAWDPAKKKYVGGWSDSMTPGVAVTESTWDAATKTMSGTMETPDGSGGTVKMRSTVEYAAGKRVMSLFMTGSDGKEMSTMRITYTKRP